MLRFRKWKYRKFEVRNTNLNLFYLSMLVDDMRGLGMVGRHHLILPHVHLSQVLDALHAGHAFCIN